MNSPLGVPRNEVMYQGAHVMIYEPQAPQVYGGGTTGYQETHYWTKPDGPYTHARIFLIGGGGGGGSGRAASSGTTSGGGGGGGSAYVDCIVPFEALAPLERIRVGRGGQGAPSQTVVNTNGLVGGQGGPSDMTIGGMAMNSSTTNVRLLADGGAGGLGGGTTSATGGQSGVTTGCSGGTILWEGTDGESGSNTAGADATDTPVLSTLTQVKGPAGGGGGSGDTSLVQGGDGGDCFAAATYSIGLGGNQVSEQQPGEDGYSVPRGVPCIGAGGQGGAQGSPTPTNGGKGGRYGAGGGGGGAKLDFVSGSGGNGATGIVVVMCF